jgi:translation initiation factor IF-2
MAEKGADVIKKMMEMGVMVTINQTIDADTAELVVEEMGHIPNRVSESDVEEGLEGPEDKEEDLEPRAPVVTVMGHVDHGKTSLLDALRETDVVGGESGGITQHIGAYQVTTSDDRKVTFIDTPGHAAFTEMRARGADITDIVILVIAADDSVMPQTIEAINHAKAADVPIIVAINKIDLPAADPDKIKQDLLRHEVIVEDMGGQVLATEVSAIKKQGLDELLENVILQSEVLELRANPDRRAHGAVVEAKLEQGRGNVATVLIQTGTLSVGDIFVAGAEWGRVRALIDDHGERIDSAGPSQPVEVLGLNGAPMAGDDFAVVEDEAKAREVSEYRTRKQREREAAIRARGSVEQMLSQIEDTGEAKLPIIIKADVHGSVEAIQGALRQLDEDHPEVDITAIHTGVGGINESDISLAAASNALVVGFNVRANAQARDLAKRDGVDMHYYSIIYNVIDDIKGMLSGMLSPEESESTLGYADVRQVFSVSKVGNVAGCRVTEGVIQRNANARLIRDDVVIHETKIDSLKRGKDDAKEVREGFECGIHLEGFDDIKEGDVIECFEIEEIERTL